MKTSKKGFTIVELTIVIAVIAILAAVLIPTFVSLVKKANNSADVQMVTNINKYLAALEVTDGKNVTMHEAVLDAKEAGYDLTKVSTANPDNILIWNQESNRFLIVDEDNDIVVSDETATWGDGKTDKKRVIPSYMYWSFYNKMPETQNYSIYFIGKNIENVEVSVGFDAGYYTGDFEVKYNKDRSSDESIILRTNCGDLSVSGNATVSHYGYAKKVTLNGATRYSEYGYVAEVGKSAFVGKYTAVKAYFCWDERTVKNALGEELEVTVAHYEAHYDNGEGVCALCGDPTHIHTMREPQVSPATCVADGYSFSQCTGCGYVKFETTAKFGHDYSIVLTEEKEATCKEPGHTKGLECSRCGDQQAPKYIHQLNHNFVNGECTMCHEKYSDKVLNCNMIRDALEKGVNLLDENGAAYFQLQEDVTLSFEQFSQLFCVKQNYHDVYWDPELKDWVVPEYKLVDVDVYVANILDIDLNGFTLVINDGELADPLFSDYFFRVTDTSEANTGVLSLGKRDFFGAGIVLCNDAGAEIVFENITVKSESKVPVCIGIIGAGTGLKLTVKNCELHTANVEEGWYAVDTTRAYEVLIDDYSKDNISALSA